jgi:hypothetical protein
MILNLDIDNYLKNISKNINKDNYKKYSNLIKLNYYLNNINKYHDLENLDYKLINKSNNLLEYIQTVYVKMKYEKDNNKLINLFGKYIISFNLLNKELMNNISHESYISLHNHFIISNEELNLVKTELFSMINSIINNDCENLFDNIILLKRHSKLIYDDFNMNIDTNININIILKELIDLLKKKNINIEIEEIETWDENVFSLKINDKYIYFDLLKRKNKLDCQTYVLYDNLSILIENIDSLNYSTNYNKLNIFFENLDICINNLLNKKINIYKYFNHKYLLKNKEIKKMQDINKTFDIINSLFDLICFNNFEINNYEELKNEDNINKYIFTIYLNLIKKINTKFIEYINLEEKYIQIYLIKYIKKCIELDVFGKFYLIIN